MKQAGRKLDHRNTQQGTSRRSSRLRDKGSGGCFVCGSEEHCAFTCPNRVRSSKTEKDRKITFNAAAGEQKQKRLKIDSDWNKYIKRGEKDSDEESDEVRMMLSYSCGNFVEEVHMVEDDGYMFLDSCASKRLFIVKDQSVLESFVYSGGSIQTTRAGVNLKTGKRYGCVMILLKIFVQLVCCARWVMGYSYCEFYEWLD